MAHAEDRVTPRLWDVTETAQIEGSSQERQISLDLVSNSAGLALWVKAQSQSALRRAEHDGGVREHRLERVPHQGPTLTRWADWRLVDTTAERPILDGRWALPEPISGGIAAGLPGDWSRTGAW